MYFLAGVFVMDIPFFAMGLVLRIVQKVRKIPG